MLHISSNSSRCTQMRAHDFTLAKKAELRSKVWEGIFDRGVGPYYFFTIGVASGVASVSLADPSVGTLAERSYPQDTLSVDEAVAAPGRKPPCDIPNVPAPANFLSAVRVDA